MKREAKIDDEDDFSNPSSSPEMVSQCIRALFKPIVSVVE